MKKPKVKKTKIDISKVSYRTLEKEIERRQTIENQKSADKSIKEISKAYTYRNECEVLGRAYLPSYYNYTNHRGISQIKKVKIASLNFASGQYSEIPSKFEMNVCGIVGEKLRSAIGRDNKKVTEFWKKMKKDFKILMDDIFKDPAYIAAMVATASDDFFLETNASETEIKYYNKIILNFNKAVVKRFENYTDEELLAAIERLKTGELGFGGDEDDAKDVIIGVLKTRGHKLETHREKWDRYDEIEDEDEADEFEW